MKNTDEKLALSLTAETTELIPFLPYLLLDLWELGSDPEVMVSFAKKHLHISKDTKILDLACGKGAVSVNLAKNLGVKVKGIDLMPEFIESAKQKAKEFDVDDLCEFLIDDVNKAVSTEAGYDCVVFGAAGVDVLGGPAEALKKLKATVKPGGYILIDEAYLPDDSSGENVKSKAEYITHSKWMQLFQDNGLRLVEEQNASEELDFDEESKNIALRANELAAKHPEKRTIFESYVKSQLDECEDLENNIVGVTWMLRFV